jgi:hypothetical protein
MSCRHGPDVEASSYIFLLGAWLKTYQIQNINAQA